MWKKILYSFYVAIIGSFIMLVFLFIINMIKSTQLTIEQSGVLCVITFFGTFLGIFIILIAPKNRIK